MNWSRWIPVILLSACGDLWIVDLYFPPSLEIKPVFINISRCVFLRMYISSWGNILLISIYLPDQAYQFYYSDVQLHERWITKHNQNEQIFLPTSSSRLLHVDLRPGYQPTHLQSHRPFYCLTSIRHLSPHDTSTFNLFHWCYNCCHGFCSCMLASSFPIFSFSMFFKCMSL